ncbi:hypothetical protein ISD40_09120, partial [Pseudomonas aeruginosa]|nr:hypothetical protein [Pseudomonas aeruginosa]
MNVNTYVLSGEGLDRIVLKNGSVMTWPEVVAELNRLSGGLDSWPHIEVKRFDFDVTGCQEAE